MHTQPLCRHLDVLLLRGLRLLPVACVCGELYVAWLWPLTRSHSAKILTLCRYVACDCCLSLVSAVAFCLPRETTHCRIAALLQAWLSFSHNNLSVRWRQQTEPSVRLAQRCDCSIGGRGTSETRGGAYMGFPERLDTILNSVESWTEDTASKSHAVPSEPSRVSSRT